MTKRKGNHSHYEESFESILRSNEILYIAIDESKKPIYNHEKIKNFDFIVSSFNGKYLVEIKGKRFATSPWSNWVRINDLTGLKNWGTHFSGFMPIIVIMYWIEETKHEKVLKSISDIIEFKKKKYALLAINLSDFYSRAKQGRTKWEAIGITRQELIEISHPLRYFIPEIRKKW